MRILQAALAYFGLVFGTGFLLGIVRTLWLLPRLGTRTAELLEMPVMLFVVIIAARWVVKRFRIPPVIGPRLAVGFVALGIVLSAEIALAFWLRGLTPDEYFATRDPVSGTAYYVVLAIFALLPCFVRRG